MPFPATYRGPGRGFGSRSPDSVSSKKVQAEYLRITSRFTELAILLDLPEEELHKVMSPEIANAIVRTRTGDIKVIPGYDGEYGKIQLFERDESATGKKTGKASLKKNKPTQDEALF